MFDLITVGRIGVDLYPLQDGLRIPDVTSFGKYLGGSPTNVAVAAARHGRRTAVVTRTGDDPFGVYVKQELVRLGVDARWVGPVTGSRTTLAFCEILPPDDFPLYFVRDDLPPELRMDVDDVEDPEIARARVLWLTASGFSREPSRAAHHALLARHGGTTVLDLDWRPGFWSGEDEARAELQGALAAAEVVVGNREECRIAVGCDEPGRAADALLGAGARLAVVKLGSEGALAATADERIMIAPIPVRVVNGLGAGDAFGGALVHGLLAGWPLARTVAFASAAGAIVTGRRECSTAMPTSAEVEELLER